MPVAPHPYTPHDRDWAGTERVFAAKRFWRQRRGSGRSRTRFIRRARGAVRLGRLRERLVGPREAPRKARRTALGRRRIHHQPVGQRPPIPEAGTARRAGRTGGGPPELHLLLGGRHAVRQRCREASRRVLRCARSALSSCGRRSITAIPRDEGVGMRDTTSRMQARRTGPHHSWPGGHNVTAANELFRVGGAQLELI